MVSDCCLKWCARATVVSAAAARCICSRGGGDAPKNLIYSHVITGIAGKQKRRILRLASQLPSEVPSIACASVTAPPCSECMPQEWLSTWATVMADLPAALNSGQCVLTGSLNCGVF